MKKLPTEIAPWSSKLIFKSISTLKNSWASTYFSKSNKQFTPQKTVKNCIVYYYIIFWYHLPSVTVIILSHSRWRRRCPCRFWVRVGVVTCANARCCLQITCLSYWQTRSSACHLAIQSLSAVASIFSLAA